MTRKIFRSILAVSLFALLLGFAAVSWVLYQNFNTVQKAQLSTQMTLAKQGVMDSGDAYLKGLDTGAYRITWIDGEGNVLADTWNDAASMENHADRDEVRSALSTGAGESTRYSATLGEKTLYYANALPDGTVLRISVTQKTVLSLLLFTLPSFLIILLALTIFSAFLSRRLSRRIVEPLNKIDLDHPLENDAYEELSPLLTRIAQQRREIDRQLSVLKRKQDEFAAIISSMNEGLVLLNEKGLIISINPAARELFHAGADEAGQDFLTVERGREIALALSEAFETGHGETIASRNGRQYQVDASRILSEGQTVGAVLLAFDVTDKMQAEQRRREFTANVSHELKTPLQSILGSAELMENSLVKPEDMQRFASLICKEAERLVALINDTLRLSQLDEEHGELPVETVALRALCLDAAERLAPQAKALQIHVTVAGDEIFVPGIKPMLSEIVFNLLDNGIKYNRTGGTVTVSIAKEDPFATLTVSDTGIGIPGEHLDRVFERFYRVDKSRSKSTGGTGLGLSIVKHAVDVHHGEIHLESRPDSGTIVTVRLPLNKTPDVH